MKGASNSTENAFRHNLYRNVRGEAGIAAIAIMFSLGLLIPWASVRMARYRLANLRLYVAGELDHFVASEQEQVSAVGEASLDFFDFDVGL